MQSQPTNSDNDRIRILRQTESRAVVSDLVAWTNQLKTGNVAK